MNLQILHTQIFFTEVYSRVYTWAVQCIQYMVISVIASKLQVEFGHLVSDPVEIICYCTQCIQDIVSGYLYFYFIKGSQDTKRKFFRRLATFQKRQLTNIFSIHMKGKQGIKNAQLVTHNIISACRHLSVYFPVHYFFKSTEAKQLARQGIEQVLPPKQSRRPLPCLLIPSFFNGKRGWNQNKSKRSTQLYGMNKTSTKMNYTS